MRNEKRPWWTARGFRTGLDASRARRIVLHAFAVGAAIALQTGTSDGPSGGATVLFAVLLALWAGTACVRHLLPQPAATLVWSVLLVGGAVSAALSTEGPAGPAFVSSAGLFLLVSSVETSPAWIAAAAAAGVAGFGLANAAAGGTAADATSMLLSAASGGGFGFLARMSGVDRRSERDAAERRAQNAVLEERARIAREIHDVLAHSLGGLVIQLDALEAVTSARGAGADVVERVRGAREMAADGLVEAKRAVDALRRLPAGIDAALGEIVARARALGTDVRVDLRGDPARVPATVAEVVASVTVETLTNARKHVPGSAVTVDLDVGRDAVVLRVANPLPPAGTRPAVPSGGHGVKGMRERAEIVGGTLDAGERDGTWSVECRVPYE